MTLTTSAARSDGPAISGETLGRDTGEAIGGVTVIAYVNRLTNTRVASTTSDASGAFRLRVPSGTYELTFLPPTGSGLGLTWWQNATGVLNAAAVSVAGEVSGMRVLMPGGHEIRGRLLDAATGQTLTGDVQVVPSGCNGVVAQVTTDGSGFYRVPVVPGSYYLFAYASASGYAPTKWPSALTCGNAQRRTVASSDVDATDIQLVHGSPVSGFILDARTGAPLADGRVSIYLGGPTATGSEEERVNTYVPNSQGRWQINLPNGSYRFRFWVANDPSYHEQWWNGGLSFPDAKDVVVNNAAVINVTARLTK